MFKYNIYNIQIPKYVAYGFLVAGVITLIMNAGIAAWSLYCGRLKLVSDDYNAKITVLQKQISGLQDQLTLANEESTKAALSTQEIVNRQTAIQKSEQPTVTSSVAKAAPAVVSIVISKDIPQYTVVYKNPFGDDPFFQDVGIRVPVYVPTGKTQTQKIGAGTGFLVSSNGYIVTNKHVVADENASYTVLLSTETQEQATVVYRDTTNDIAIIKITGNNYPVIHFADSSTLKLGQTVIAIGQYNNSVSIEVVSGLNRTITAFTSGGCFPDAYRGHSNRCRYYTHTNSSDPFDPF